MPAGSEAGFVCRNGLGHKRFRSGSVPLDSYYPDCIQIEDLDGWPDRDRKTGAALCVAGNDGEIGEEPFWR